MKFRIAVLPIVVGLFGLTVGAALPAVAAAPVSQGARVRAVPLASWPGSTSGNWSGYAGGAKGSNKLTFASATWKVPSVAAKTGYSSTWVGIDGDTNNDLIQTGTEQDYVKGKFTYRAWWEILPAAETLIPSLTITPGDTMSGSVKDTSGNNWVISLTDVTTGKSFSINKTYTGPGASAEWIQEAPFNGSILPLAHYSETEFSNIEIGLNFASPANPNLTFPTEAIAMVQHGKQVSTPSKPTGGNSFNVAYGKKQPTAP
jgi:hypothetical protein